MLKEGEMVLKGLNKKSFEHILIKNIRNTLRGLGKFSYSSSQSVITVTPLSEYDTAEVVKRLGCVFGIAGYSKAAVSDKEFNILCETATEYLKDELQTADTFKVKAKRGDKSYFLTSPQIEAKLGEIILDRFKNLKVDVISPQIEVGVEIRDDFAYIYSNKLKAALGMPVNSSGRGMLMISGGIDSPVAGWMMAKRGLGLCAVHFITPPYTGARALKKVETLLSIIARYCGNIPLYVVNFTEIAKELKRHCKEEYFTILMRRIMVRIAQEICSEENKKGKSKIECLISGESLGQVASQTLKAMACTDAVLTMPHFRPLVGMDKEEIVKISRRIGTFETSTLPYEDCCSVFTPKHPRTKPKLEETRRQEYNIDCKTCIDNALKNVRFSIVKPNWII